jgi:hypothetical protein
MAIKYPTEDTMKLVKYTIQVRDPVLGYWKDEHVVWPFVEITKCHVSKIFSTKVVEGTVEEPPSEKAQHKCREVAMLWAFEFYQGIHENVRVRKTYQYKDGDTYTKTIWENSEWKDC